MTSRRSARPASTSSHARVPASFRRIVIAAAWVGLMALWLAARIRWTGDPVASTATRVLPLQPATTARAANLAVQISRVQQELGPAVLALPGPRRAGGLVVPGLRIGPDVAMLLASARERGDLPKALALDPVSGLAIARVPRVDAGIRPRSWSPARLETPRFVLSTTAGRRRLSLQPVFVARLDPIGSTDWKGSIWAVPDGVHLIAGSFLFTEGGELIGIVAERGGSAVVVPADVALARADALLESVRSSAGTKPGA